jgi:hypothetical protein
MSHACTPIRFTKIQNNHDRIPDDVIEGYTYHLPIIPNKPFFFFGPGRDNPHAMKAVNTSVVTKIVEESEFHWVFETESGSTYQVERLS